MDNLFKNLNRRFDHAALKSEVTENDIITLCRDAVEYNLFSVAVNPVWVKTARKELSGKNTRILSVAGFPLGASRTDIKINEAVKGINDGAAEIDMVANIGWLVSGDYSQVEHEITEIRKNLPYNVILKVIIEAGKLTKPQQVAATRCVVNGGAQFVKTCTGFFGGTDILQVSTLFQAAQGKIEVKASGGIKTLEDCQNLLQAGASRLGSSASVAIMKELTSLS